MNLQEQIKQRTEMVREVLDSTEQVKGAKFKDAVLFLFNSCQIVLATQMLGDIAHAHAERELPEVRGTQASAAELLMGMVGHYLSIVGLSPQEREEAQKLAISLANRLTIKVPK